MHRTALAILSAIALAVSATTAAAAPKLRDGHGINVVDVETFDDRQFNVRIATNALQEQVDVRVLLPDGYEANGKKRYPVLYLFHGTSGRASDWVLFGNAVETTAGLPLIVVMPDAGFNGDGGGWFADWYNGGRGGQPKWETFHIEQLIPWVDDNLRTVDERAGRAVAGLSQGGFGALSYAGRHPDMFTSVASFSGGCVIDGDQEAIDISTTIIQYTTQVLSGIADPDAIFGPRATNELNWQAHDPGTLVTNFRGMQIGLWTGDGTPGPLDPSPVDPGAASIEAITFGATQRFDAYLTAARIRHAYINYGGGTHIFPYWARDLSEYVAPLMKRFGGPPRRPRAVSFKTTDEKWERWDWQVTLQGAKPGFNELRRARDRGFTLSGTGTATVRTPVGYKTGRVLRVTQTGPDGAEAHDVRVGDNRRLRITVPLGDGPTPTTVRVRIRPVANQ
jgi:S-formylglutathione hydrolase FrmB